MKKLFTSLLVLATLTVGARADLLDLGLFSLDQFNPAEEADWIEDSQNLSYQLTFLTKDEYASGTKSKALSWDFTGDNFELRYILLKDGVGATQGTSLYHLYEVTPSQYVVGDSSNLPGGVVTIDGNKDISHIAWFGTPGTGVPDGGTTALLLGLALVGLGLAGRRAGLAKN